MPTVRPSHRVSQPIGYPNRMRNKPTSERITAGVSPRPPEALRPTTRPRPTRAAPMISRSRKIASMRVATPARAKSSSTASGVTMLTLVASPTRPRPEPNLSALDIDGFIQRNEVTWTRLADHTRRGRRRVPTRPGRAGPARGRLPAPRPTSPARAAYGDPGLTARLTRLVAEANSVIYGRRPRSLAGLAHFFALTFPGAVWHARRLLLDSALCALAPAVVVAAWIGTSDAAPRRSGARRRAGGLPGGGLRGVLLLGPAASSPPGSR